MTLTCLSFKPLSRGALVGFADLQLPSGLVLRECTFMESGSSRWVNPPGKPQLNADRLPIIKEGKVQYSPVVDFVDRATRRRWSDAAVVAIDAFRKAQRPEGAGRHEAGNQESTQGARHGG